jgi:hypothetical protein
MTDSNQDLVILKLDRAKQSLAEAKTIQQTKKIVDVASAAEIYANRQQLGNDAIAYAHAIRIEALRRLGELLKETEKRGPEHSKGGGSKGSKRELLLDAPPTLADLGLDRKTSMIAQQLADLPADQFKQVEAGTATIAKVLREIRRGTEGNTKKVDTSLESLEQVLRKAINGFIVEAPPGSQHRVAELLRRLLEELEEAVRPELRDAVLIARDELSVRDAEPGGFRMFEVEASTHPGAPTVIGGCPSTYPKWFKGLTTRRPGVTPLRRKQIEASLDDIEVGKLPTARTSHTHTAVMWAIKSLGQTSPLGRGGAR